MVSKDDFIRTSTWENVAQLPLIPSCYAPDKVRVSLGLCPKIVLQSLNLQSHHINFDIVM